MPDHGACGSVPELSCSLPLKAAEILLWKRKEKEKQKVNKKCIGNNFVVFHQLFNLTSAFYLRSNGKEGRKEVFSLALLLRNQI